MAAEVGTLARMLGAYVEEKRDAGSERRMELVTRDFLGVGGGGCLGAGGGVKELDLDLAAPAGWERRLDLASGEVFLQRSGSTTAAATGVVPKATDRRIQDHNPPPLLSLFPSQPTPDLGLLPPASAEYQSVCTLDKVKFALDRLASAAPANKAPQANRSSSSSASASRTLSGSRSSSRSESLSRSGSPASSSTTTSSRKQQRQQSREGGESGTTTEEDGGEGGGASMVATGCPSCLSYVLISRSRPRCPRCAAPVPSPPAKKPRLDLNLSSSSSIPAAAAANRTAAAGDRS